MCGVYKIENIKNGKLYIGQSININKRWSQHKRLLKEGTHHSYKLQKDWNKFGENNFEFSILELCEKDVLNNKEQFYIEKFNTNSRGYNCLKDVIDENVYENIKVIKNKLLQNLHDLNINNVIAIPINLIQNKFQVSWNELRMAVKFTNKKDCEKYNIFIMTSSYFGDLYLCVSKFDVKEVTNIEFINEF